MSKTESSDLELSCNTSNTSEIREQPNSHELKIGALASDARNQLVFDENGLVEVTPQIISHVKEEFVLSNGLEVKDMNFENNDLSEVEFDMPTKFVNCNFTNANLYGCDLSQVEFVDCDFSGACMNYVTIGIFTRCTLGGVSLLDFDFTEDSVLILCDFEGATMGISLTDVEIVIIDCVFKNIKSFVDGVVPFIQAFVNLDRKFSLKDDGTFDIDFTGCTLKKGIELKKFDLKGVEFRVMDLKGADLRSVDLRGMDLRGMDLSRAKLNFTDLRGADLRGADLSEVNFYSLFLEGALVDETTQIDFLEEEVYYIVDCKDGIKRISRHFWEVL